MKGKISAKDGSGEVDISPKDLNALQKFFSSITPGFLKDGVGILDDNVKYARWKNILRITLEAEKLKKKNNLQIKALPLKPTVEFLEAASLEEEPTMQTMWANLLANMSSVKESTQMTYIAILKELSPVEAKILNSFYILMQKNNFRKYPSYIKSRTLILRESYGENDEIEILMDNLVRLRLLKQPEPRKASIPSSLGFGGSILSYSGGLEGTSDNKISAETKKILDYLEDQERNNSYAVDMVELTPLGFSFLKTCNEAIKNQD